MPADYFRVAGYSELVGAQWFFGCGGPIRNEHTILEPTVPQRIDSGGCLKLMLSRTKQRTRATVNSVQCRRQGSSREISFEPATTSGRLKNLYPHCGVKHHICWI